MNSLNDLNNYSIDVEYTDDRAPFVGFDKLDPTNQTASIFQGQTTQASLGIEILDIAGWPDTMVNYTIDVSNLPGTVVVWNTIPTGCVVTNPSPGIYNISVIKSKNIWDIVKSPTIIQPADFYGTFTYQSTINYFTTLNKSWYTTITVTDVEEWNTTTLNDFWFTPGIENTITPVPQLSNIISPNAITAVTITPSKPGFISSITATGTGGSTSFNPVTKVLTINGSNSQINTYLNNLKMTSTLTAVEHMTFTYRATSLQFGYIDAVIQNIKSESIRYLGEVRSNFTYAEDDAEFSIGTFTPLITHEEYSGSGSYTMVIETTGANYLSSGGSGGTSTWSSGTNRLTITGTKTQVNSHLSTVNFKVKSDLTSNFTITYTLTTPTGQTVAKTQSVTNTASHEEVSNMNITRTYDQGVTAKLFPNNIPSITDLDPTNPNYSITFSSSIGTFSYTMPITGNKSTIQGVFNSIDFIPSSGAYQDSIISYTQVKGGVTQVSTSFTISGPNVKLDNLNPVGTTISINEGQTFQVYAAANIIEFASGATASYTIDVSNRPGALVSWSSIPSGCVLTNPSTGVYVVSNITSVSQWNTIKNPTISLTNDYFGNFNYTASIGYGSRSKSWINSVVVNDVFPLTTLNNFEYYSGNTQNITAYALINDAGNQNPTWTVVLTPTKTESISTITTGGSGGTVNFNSTTKVLTISGTIAQVNSHLESLTLTSILAKDLTYTVNWSATNNINSESGTRSQVFSSNNTTILSPVSGDETYTLNTAVTTTKAPNINLLPGANVVGYTYDIKAVPAAAVSNISIPSFVLWGLNQNLYINIWNSQYDSYSMYTSQDGNTIAVNKLGFNILIYKKISNTWQLFQDVALTMPPGPGKFSLSGDGNSFAVGSNIETRIDIYRYNGSQYVFETMLQPTPNDNDPNYNQYGFGVSSALNFDGTKLAVLEAGAAPDPNPQRTSYVYIYNKVNGIWNQETRFFPTTNYSIFPYGNLRLDNVGTTLMIVDNTGGPRTYIYYYSNNTWNLQANILGHGIDINPDGNKITIDNKLYSRSGSTWSIEHTFPTTMGRIRMANNGTRFIGVTVDGDWQRTLYDFIKEGSSFVQKPNILIASPYYLREQPTFFDSFDISENGNTLSYIKYREGVSFDLDVFDPRNAVWNPTTKTLTITADAQNVNLLNNSITITPSTGYTQDFEIYYTATHPNSSNSTRNQYIRKV